MAIENAALTAAQDLTDRTVYTTGSIDPTDSALVILFVISDGNVGGGAVVAPTVVGNSLTWVQIHHAEFNTIATPVDSVTMFRGLVASPSAGTVAITYAEDQNSATWIIREFTGIDTSGTNGSGAIVQAVKNSIDSGGADADYKVTFASFTDTTNNAALHCAGQKGSGTFSVDSGAGYTELIEVAGTTTCAMQWNLGNTELTPQYPDSASRAHGQIGIEIKAAASVAPKGAVGHLGINLGW